MERFLLLSMLSLTAGGLTSAGCSGGSSALKSDAAEAGADITSSDAGISDAKIPEGGAVPDGKAGDADKFDASVADRGTADSGKPDGSVLDVGPGPEGGSADVGNTGGGIVYPLKVLPGARYLVDQNGKPFVFVGDTPWSLIVQLTKPETETYLEDRRRKGFTALLVNLIEHEYATNPPKNRAGDDPFTTPGDFSKPNEAYFAHADWVIARAGEKGLAMFLTPAYLGFGGGGQGWYQEMLKNGPTKLRGYGEYLGNRYKSFSNIVWVNGGDYAPPDRSVVTAIVDGITAADPRLLHTVHNSRTVGAQDYWDASKYPWLDIDNIYTREDVYPAARLAYQRTGWMPFFLIEAYYEGETAGPLMARKQAWEAMLSGAFGHFFGNNPLWGFTSGWQAAMNLPGSVAMGHMATFLRARPAHLLVPDFSASFLTAGRGSGVSDRASAALVAGGTLGVVYVPTTRTLTVDLGKMSGAITARWLDPTTGSYAAIAGSPFAPAARTFTSPASNAGGDRDWLLVLESN